VDSHFTPLLGKNGRFSRFLPPQKTCMHRPKNHQNPFTVRLSTLFMLFFPCKTVLSAAKKNLLLLRQPLFGSTWITSAADS
jgi:hypothetical protein